MPQFQTGNSYGKGRPRGSKLNELCKKFAKEEGFERLIERAKGFYRDSNDQIRKAGWAEKKPAKGKGVGRLVWVGPSDESQFEALKLALAYGAGKPTESVDVTSNGESLAEWAFQHFAIRGNGNGSSGLHGVSGEDHK